MLRGALGVGIAALLSGTAHAGAWPLDPGRTQVIFKYEPSSADFGYDPDGRVLPLPGRLREDVLSAFVERGITPRLTFQGKMSWQSGEDQFVRYDGLGPVELGLRLALVRTRHTVVSAYVGGVLSGEGRNAAYARPGQGDGDFEARLLVGHSGRLFGARSFGELQVARLLRAGLPDETRIEGATGVTLFRRWQVLQQVYAGQADGRPVSPQWIKTESSVVRRLGPWSLQVGWRRTVYGRETSVESGPVIALWRRF